MPVVFHARPLQSSGIEGYDSTDIQWVKHSENIGRMKKYIYELKRDVWAKATHSKVSVCSVAPKGILKYIICSPDTNF